MVGVWNGPDGPVRVRACPQSLLYTRDTFGDRQHGIFLTPEAQDRAAQVRVEGGRAKAAIHPRAAQLILDLVNGAFKHPGVLFWCVQQLMPHGFLLHLAQGLFEFIGPGSLGQKSKGAFPEGLQKAQLFWLRAKPPRDVDPSNLLLGAPWDA